MLRNDGKPYMEQIFIEPNEMDQRLMEFNAGRVFSSNGLNIYSAIHHAKQ